MKRDARFVRPLELTLAVLKDGGFTPGAVIDIGVASGTPVLWDAWPEAPLCLIEPSPLAHPKLEAFARTRPNVTLFRCGASDRDGELEGSHALDKPYFVAGDVKPKWPRHVVRVRPCDDMVREAGLKGPFVYKLDTDAHDWEALHGSQWTLSQTAVVIVEMNVYGEMRGIGSPDQIWRFLHDRGFAFWDMTGGSIAANGSLRGADFVFLRRDHKIFRWAYKNSAKDASRPQ